MKPLLLILLICQGYKANAQQHDQIVHYSVMDALRNAVYDSVVSIADLKKKGNFGLGTYHLLDGELIAVDGVFYRVAPDGHISVPEDTTKSPFASITFFNADKSMQLTGGQTIDVFLAVLKKSLPSTNKPYAIQIDCEFDELHVGGSTKVAETDTIGLAALMKTRPLYTAKKIKGTIIGFYNPAYVGGVDLSPFHFHFISNNKKFGGHLISGKFSNNAITVILDEKTGYDLILPQNNKRFDQMRQSENNTNSSY